MQVNNNVSIIIVNYKKWKLTKKCIQSIIENTKNIKYEIIVIDNNSPNNSYEILKTEFKDYKYIKILKNNLNTGFGAANNFAVSKTKYEHILFLNPDVIVIDNSILYMVEKIKKSNNLGIIGCKLLNGDMSLQYSCRKILGMGEFFIARTPLKKVFSEKFVQKINDKYLMKDYDHESEIDVDWVMGSCILIKKSLFNEINGFSREYFMYFEDVDLCYKVNKINKKVLYYPMAKMIHLHEQGSVKRINKLTFIHFQSMFKFYFKYYFNKKK